VDGETIIESMEDAAAAMTIARGPRSQGARREICLLRALVGREERPG